MGKHLFEECIQSYLKGKTRILVTHQLQHLKGADAIIFLDQGKMFEFANHNRLLEAHPEFECLLTKDQASEGEHDEQLNEKSCLKRKISSTSRKVSQ